MLTQFFNDFLFAKDDRSSHFHRDLVNQEIEINTFRFDCYGNILDV
jgi:hypothetical protein